MKLSEALQEIEVIVPDLNFDQKTKIITVLGGLALTTVEIFYRKMKMVEDHKKTLDLPYDPIMKDIYNGESGNWTGD